MNHDMTKLEKFTSKDAHQIWSVSCDVAKSTNIDELKALSEYLETIKAAMQGVELGGKLCPNSYHLEFAIEKLEYVKNVGGCLCELYSKNIFFSPDKEQEFGNIVIDSTVKIDGKWVDYYLCRCNRCQSKFKVLEREGHFTWWSWQKA